MQTPTDLFEIELLGDTLIVTPRHSLRELEFHEIEEKAAEVVNFLRSTSARNVVVDLHRTDYCGSTALGAFAQFWQVVKARQGRMALCNISEHEEEVLQVTNLETLWPICANRAAALALVNSAAIRTAE